MDKFGWYLLTSGICLGLLLLPYRFWLSKLTHFQWNRVYLLAALGLSLLLPWLAMQWSPLGSGSYLVFPEMGTHWVMNAGSPDSEEVSTRSELGIPYSDANPGQTDEGAGVEPSVAALAPKKPTHLLLSPWDGPASSSTLVFFTDQGFLFGIQYGKWILWGLYFLGLSIGLLGLFRGILQVFRIYKNSPKETRSQMILVYPEQLPGSFSFFRMLFISPSDKDSADRPVIEAHERAHIRQWHSLDVLLGEIACRMWWFLPWSRYLRSSLKETHEYLADTEAADILTDSRGKSGKVAYSRLVLAHAVRNTAKLPVHYFAQSKTAKRIKMLNRKRSSGKSRFLYLGVLPILLLAFGLMACIPSPDQPLAPSDPESVAGSSLATNDENFDTEGTSNAGGLTFAGENFPDEARFREGLKAKLERLRENPDYCQKVYLRAQRFRSEIGDQLSDEGIPADFFYLAVAESNLDAQAVSSMGACGVWQFMPGTAKNYGIIIDGNRDDRQDLDRSTHGAALYLQEQYVEFGSWTAAALAYNRGPNAVRDGNPARTIEGWYGLDHERGYLYRILAIKTLLEDPGAFGVKGGPGFTMPLADADLADVSSEFGPRKSPFDGKVKNHTGVDLKAAMGAEIRAVADGVVSVADGASDKKIGNHIEIEHVGGLESRYNHLQEVRVKAGETVKRGQVIGTVGTTGLSTGPHLHLEVREDGIAVDPGLYLGW